MENVKVIVVNGPNGQQEYGIEDAEARENVQEIVEGAPEELNTFKEAFDAFKEGSDALAVVVGAITAETERAQGAEQVLDDKIAEELHRATEAEQGIEAKALDAGSAEFKATENAVALKFTTIEGAGNEAAIPAATTSTAGVMSAEDKKKLDGLSQGGGNGATIEQLNAVKVDVQANTTAINKEVARATQAELDAAERGRQLALRSLYVAAGAEYNDTDEVIKKTAPWKTEETWVKNADGTYTYSEVPAIVDHLPHHYYLNGLGDITEEQMTSIYIETFPMTKQPDWYNSIRGVTVRTNLFPKFFYAATIVKKIDAAFYNTKIDVIRTCHTDDVATSLAQGFLLNECSVKYIYGDWDVKSFNSLKSYATNNVNLRHIKIRGLKGDTLIFNKSQHIYKRSILYAIQNASPTTAITITLHPDAYARIANDADIVAALAAQPLITLVSA